MTAAPRLRVAAVLDATGAAGERHARALAGFLRDGLTLPRDTGAEAVTHLFHALEADHEHVVELAPTRRVRVEGVPPHRPDLLAAALAAFEAADGADLYVFPGGPLGVELAARLAARSGGSVLTGVHDARLDGGDLTCRRAAWSGHLTTTVVLGPRPWCIALDASWADARPLRRTATAGQAPQGHFVESAAPASGDVSEPPPYQDVEPLEPPQTGDLETARFLVVAGRGCGSGGVGRVAAAAARMGAAFGVTRPVVMNAWAAPDRQVGVSGTRTAPAVCIVAGASGAPAFLWGVERAAFIAAVDTDDHAPIAAEADAMVVGDAVAVVEALADILAADA